MTGAACHGRPRRQTLAACPGQRGAHGLLLLALGLGVAGCGDGGGEVSSRPDTSVQDSAGVEMVVSSGPDRPLVATEVFRIGVIEGDPDYQFSSVRGLVLDDRNGVWVADDHPVVRHYDQTGAFTGTVGGVGEGPGESPEGYRGGWWDGRQLVLSAYGAAAQAFDADGSYVETVPRTTPDGSALLLLGSAGAAWIGSTSEYPDPSDPAPRHVLRILTAPELSGPWSEVVALDAGAVHATPGGEFGRGSFFDGRPSFAVGGAGGLHRTHELEYRIERWSLQGELTQVIRRDVPPTPFDESIRQSFDSVARYQLETPLQFGGITRPTGVVTQEAVDRISNSMLPVGDPPHIPFILGLFASREGVVWVERADRHPRIAHLARAKQTGLVRSAWLPRWLAPPVFDLFEPDGAYRGTVELPEVFVPLAVTADRIYGFVTDELDVEYIVGFAVTEAG